MVKRAKKVNDPLESILGAAITDVHQRLEFYRTFLEMELVVLGTVSPDATDELYLKYIEVDYELVLPVYSTIDKFHTIFPTHQPYIKIKTKDLLEYMEPGASLVVNPGFDVSKKLIPEELETLRDRSILAYFFDQLPALEKEKYMVEKVVTVPDTTIPVLSSCLRNFPSIEKAYLTNLYDPVTGEPPYVLVGLEVKRQDKEKDRALLLQVVKSVEPYQEIKMEFVILDESLPLTSSIIKHIEPFYVGASAARLKKMFR